MYLTLALALALVLWLLWRRRRGRSTLRSQTAEERAFDSTLNAALAGLPVPIRAFARVKIADVLAPGRGDHRSDWLAEFAQLRDKQFDFVLCDAHSLAMLAAIELVRGGRRKRSHDVVVEAACQRAQLALLRFPAQRHYQQDEVRQALIEALPQLTQRKETPTLSPERQDEAKAEAAQAESSVLHLSTEELAARLGMRPMALIELFAKQGYLEWAEDGQMQLTEEGKRKGAVQWDDPDGGRQFQWSVRHRGQGSGQG
ncbi:DUF2726 domain-containing protein [Ferrimonas marina]|uniref:DUF2726 domain-containing protein n=1 Tax=Ferrimonas marina TaxID=299255 RepID=UPI00083665EE|nr:DUF2726 domain-containing protein [Ferrimonas marina]